MFHVSSNPCKHFQGCKGGSSPSVRTSTVLPFVVWYSPGCVPFPAWSSYPVFCPFVLNRVEIFSMALSGTSDAGSSPTLGGSVGLILSGCQPWCDSLPPESGSPQSTRPSSLKCPSLLSGADTFLTSSLSSLVFQTQ